MFCNFFDNVFGEFSNGSVFNPVNIKDNISFKFYPIFQHDSHEFLIHILSMLQDEETPVSSIRFNGDASTYKKGRPLDDIVMDYFVLNPGFIDNLFTVIKKATI